MRSRWSLVASSLSFFSGYSSRAFSDQDQRVDRSTFDGLFHDLHEDLSARKPLKSKRILLSVSRKYRALGQLSLLQQAGASVELVVEPGSQEDVRWLTELQQAGVVVYQSDCLPENKRSAYYDIVYDRKGNLLNRINPKLGFVEQDRVIDMKPYANITFPVMALGDSRTARSSLSMGAADSLIRLLAGFSEKELHKIIHDFLPSDGSRPIDRAAYYNLSSFLAAVDPNNLFANKGFVIIGYGALGYAIASALRRSGVRKENILVADVRPMANFDAFELGFSFFNLKLKESQSELKRLLPKAFAVITATGEEGVFSQYFDAADIARVPYLLNMGDVDEFGSKIPAEWVVCQKKMANLMLESPIRPMFLAPLDLLSVYAACELLDAELAAGLNALPAGLESDLWGRSDQAYQASIWKSEMDVGKKLAAWIALARNRDLTRDEFDAENNRMQECAKNPFEGHDTELASSSFGTFKR